MRSLVSLLEAAVRRSATEVVLESGQPVVYTTARGAEAEQNVLPRTELFDMIAAAVDDAQQVELAVGNPVEFTVDAGGSWTVQAEPGMEGMTVRAHRRGSRAGLEIQLEDEPGFSLDQPNLGVEDEGFDGGFEATYDDEPRTTKRMRSGVVGGRPRSPFEAPPSQLYVEALDVPAIADPEQDFNTTARIEAAPAAPFESGTWALADEEDFGFDEPPDAARLPTGFPEPAVDAGHIGVPDDDDESPFDPFAEPGADDHDERRRRTLSPTLPAVNAARPRATGSTAAASRSQSAPIVGAERPPSGPSTSGRPPSGPSSSAVRPPSGPAASVKRPASGPAAPSFADKVTHREITAAASPRAATRREISTVGSPDADTHRELPSVGRSHPALGDLAASIGEGTLVYVYVREPGFAESLAQSFAAPSIVVDDEIDPNQVWARVRGLPAGAIIIVRREDPSVMLGWILRRLEEGYRVFLETRARTPAGARRTLLGVGASERAEAWLDSQVVLVLEPGEGGPRVRQAS